MSILVDDSNKTACRAAEAGLQQKNCAALVRPAGTGKGCIVWELLDTHPEMRVLWVVSCAARLELRRALTKRLGRTLGGRVRLMSCEQLAVQNALGWVALAEFRPGLLVLDGWREMSAKDWADCVQPLFRLCPGAKLLALGEPDAPGDSCRAAEEMLADAIVEPLALGGAISLVGGKYYAVVDQAYVDGLNSGKDAWTLCGADEVNWRTGMMTLKDKPLENVQGSIDDAVSAGWAFKADTIEALAQAIDAPELVETLDEYNGYCADGNDEQFYKPACFLQPVTTGPFYAFQYEPSAWVTIGGIRTNDRLQAIDGEGVAIPGLYVAGADNGTLMSAPYCDYEGYSLMCAYCGGRLAGQYAVETIDA